MTPLPAPCLLCGLEPASPTSAAWKAKPPASSPSRAVFAPDKGPALLHWGLLRSQGGGGPGGEDLLQRPQRDSKAREAQIIASGEDPRKSSPCTRTSGFLGRQQSSAYTPPGRERGGQEEEQGYKGQ